MAQATRTLLLSSFSSFFVDPPQPMAVRRCPKKKKKKFWKKLNVIPETSIQRSCLPSPADSLIAVFEKSVLVVYVGETPYCMVGPALPKSISLLLLLRCRARPSPRGARWGAAWSSRATRSARTGARSWRTGRRGRTAAMVPV